VYDNVKRFGWQRIREARGETEKSYNLRLQENIVT
jgi:hypothetical protein